MNTELLLKVKDQIMKEPDTINMDVWECGTCRCIGGWAIVLSGDRVDHDACITDYSSPFNLAQSLLDLSERQALELFIAGNWPNGFKCGQRPSAELTARRIDAFIEQYGGAQ